MARHVRVLQLFTAIHYRATDTIVPLHTRCIRVSVYRNPSSNIDQSPDSLKYINRPANKSPLSNDTRTNFLHTLNVTCEFITQCVPRVRKIFFFVLKNTASLPQLSLRFD